MTVAIQVVDGDWGGASTADINAVLNSLARCFDPATSERAPEPIRVEPTPGLDDSPIALFTRTPDGSARVLRHILAEADYLATASAGLTRDQYQLDPTLQRAFVRSLAIIGEAEENLVRHSSTEPRR